MPEILLRKIGDPVFRFFFFFFKNIYNFPEISRGGGVAPLKNLKFLQQLIFVDNLASPENCFLFCIANLWATPSLSAGSTNIKIKNNF